MRRNSGFIALATLAFAAMAALCAVGAFGVLGKPSGITSSATARPVARQSLGARPSAVPLLIVEPGTYALADRTDLAADTIAPGTYKVAATVGGTHCYVARLKDFDGTVSSILANELLQPGAMTRISVRRSDAGLQLRGDCEVTK